MRDRIVTDLEAVHLGLLVQYGNRLLAVARLMIEVGELLAVQVLHATLFHADVLDLCRILARVIGHKREYVREYLAVGGIGTAVPHRDNRYLVGGGALDEAVGDAGRERMHDSRAGWTFPLEAFVAFDTAVGVVRRLALLPGEHHATEPAVAYVEQLKIVFVAAEEPGTACGIGTGAIHEHRNELLVLGLRGCERCQNQARGDQREQRSLCIHQSLLIRTDRLSSVAAPSVVAAVRGF